MVNGSPSGSVSFASTSMLTAVSLVSTGVNKHVIDRLRRRVRDLRPLPASQRLLPSTTT